MEFACLKFMSHISSGRIFYQNSTKDVITFDVVLNTATQSVCNMHFCKQLLMGQEMYGV